MSTNKNPPLDPARVAELLAQALRGEGIAFVETAPPPAANDNEPQDVLRLDVTIPNPALDRARYLITVAASGSIHAAFVTADRRGASDSAHADDHAAYPDASTLIEDVMRWFAKVQSGHYVFVTDRGGCPYLAKTVHYGFDAHEQRRLRSGLRPGEAIRSWTGDRDVTA
jgi:hypothetical protein